MKRSKSSRILKILSYVLLITGMIVILYPFYLTIITALKTPQESSQSFFSFPQSFYLGNFVNVLQKANYFVFFRNSAVVTLVSVFLIMVLIPMCSYAIARNMEKRYYNTLNLIASMGELSDFPEIVEITKNLSCIMQYNVKGSRFVSLKTEVEMVKAYLEIQRIRFHDCFSVEYEIERQIEQVRIVKFILQPIVENIFEHGFTMDENDNKIWIKAFKCENDIVILVKDNGCGIDSEKREELNRILCERTRRISYIDEEEKSIGINNVNTRIKNYYGEKYGVKVNKADKGTEIQRML